MGRLLLQGTSGHNRSAKTFALLIINPDGWWETEIAMTLKDSLVPSYCLSKVMKEAEKRALHLERLKV